MKREDLKPTWREIVWRRAELIHPWHGTSEVWIIDEPFMLDQNGGNGVQTNILNVRSDSPHNPLWLAAVPDIVIQTRHDDYAIEIECLLEGQPVVWTKAIVKEDPRPEYTAAGRMQWIMFDQRFPGNPVNRWQGETEPWAYEEMCALGNSYNKDLHLLCASPLCVVDLTDEKSTKIPIWWDHLWALDVQ